MDRNVARVNHYSKPFDRHMSRLHGMALANLVGAFERFLKELAVVCVNELSEFSLDGRLDEFSLKEASQPLISRPKPWVMLFAKQIHG